jgi:3,4-dihydroxy 2-butanone 4-phosphate synthase/GTP cyclohydrolase II
LVRVQTINVLRDVLGADRPGFDQSWSTSASLEAISKSDCGVLVVVGQPHAPEQELAQIQSFPEIPVADRSVAESGVYRVIGAGSQILRDLGVGKMRLLSSPTRYNALSGFGLEVIEFIEA